MLADHAWEQAGLGSATWASSKDRDPASPLVCPQKKHCHAPVRWSICHAQQPQSMRVHAGQHWPGMKALMGEAPACHRTVLYRLMNAPQPAQHTGWCRAAGGGGAVLRDWADDGAQRNSQPTRGVLLVVHLHRQSHQFMKITFCSPVQKRRV